MSLCDAYDKIEIPIIQRDYAQGRDTTEVKTLREKFVSNFLIDSLLRDEAIELDFVYGSILTEKNGDEKRKIFIPLDGQQRLTTLFLLHFFIAIKEGKLNDIRSTISKFTYETRPSAKDFITKLLQMETVKSLAGIKAEIKDSVWYDDDWTNDPTVSGMLNMLDTLANNKGLREADIGLLDKIVNNSLISFYFTDLEEFGLTENLYIRMNARGKMLTEFENFKSEFSKIIQTQHDLLEEVKDKIEYSWVENLWDFRDYNSFIIDRPFMSYLSFVTEMIYYQGAEFRSANAYESNFLDLNVLSSIYSKRENIEFLIFSLDFLKDIKNHTTKILWDGASLKDILQQILQGKRDIAQWLIFYNVLAYNFEKKPTENLYDYIRVIRNLIENTADISRREWPRLIASLQSLISDQNVYEILKDDSDKLIGFNIDQRKEEVFKAKLFNNHSGCKVEIFKIEDHKYLRGRIITLLLAPFAVDESQFNNDRLEVVNYDENKLIELINIFDCYKEMGKNNFRDIFGNLLVTNVYYQTNDSRLNCMVNYQQHPGTIMLAKKYAENNSNLNLQQFVEKIQKEFITSLTNAYNSFDEIRNVKQQLYTYYIISERLYDRKFHDFFKNGNLNFGWLSKENGYKSQFANGIDQCIRFSFKNPIFQVYNQQFRYSLGINWNNTLEIEKIRENKKKKPLELIQEWASS